VSDHEPERQGHVFGRVLSRDLPTAVRAEGVWIEDADGSRYLDAAGGAIVVNVGHGDRSLVEAMSAQAARTPYVHGSVFTTQALEDYADDVATVLPMDDARIYPVSGGSEAVETAMKLARAYHLARGEDARSVVIGRSGSYHGNTIGALDVGGKPALRAPYAPWLGRFPHVDAAYEYRCTMPKHPIDCGAGHAEALDRVIEETGFGRTGRWFGLDHWGVRPDIVVAGKGSTSGYWPFGFAAASGDVFETVRPKGFVHGFTWSHNGVGAAVAHATLKRLRGGDLVEASRAQGEHLLKELTSVLADVPVVGDVRGLGLMIGIELVADRASKAPFPRADRATERVVEAAREDGLLLYSSTGHVDGTDGDLVMLGPPFVISDEECALVVERTRRAVDRIA